VFFTASVGKRLLCSGKVSGNLCLRRLGLIESFHDGKLNVF
jgi:hypothetical protein